MIFILCVLLSHILGDFIFQPKSWVDEKMKKGIGSKALWKHLLVHIILLLVIMFIYPNYWAYLLLIAGSHVVIDFLKVLIAPKVKAKIWLFCIDQILHISVIVWVYFMIFGFPVCTEIPVKKILLIGIAYLILGAPTSIFMRLVLEPLSQRIDRETQQKDDSLTNAGKYIGILERVLILTFILIQQWMAIGFLITAKSVFRFGDLTKDKNRQLTEYMLIGTLLSFLISIIIGLFLTDLLLNLS